MKRRIAFGFILFGWSAILYSQNFTGGFNFYLPPQDFTSQKFLPYFPPQPIAANAFVTIDAAGHFAVQNRPLRFFGVNCGADGAFPITSKAWFIAGRLRKFGFNLIRFHHLDNPWSQESLFEWGRDTRHLNPVTLDRMENFLAELKKNGIYANMNLHVSRTFNFRDGVRNADSLAEYAKGVTYFDPQLISLQKEYAKQLLTHVNPYTGLPLVNDPVMAMVEITNENSLYRWWREAKLQSYGRGGLLMTRHTVLLDSLWQNYLRKKYSTTAILQAAWNAGASNPGSANQIRNGTFEGAPPSTGWNLELHAPAQAFMTLSPEQPFAGQFCAKVFVQRADGTDWHVQWKQSGLSVVKDSLYAVTFAGRADSTRALTVTALRETSPWTYYAGQSFVLTPQWKTYTFTFRALETRRSDTRLAFALGGQAGTYWFDNIVFSTSGAQGLLANESLEQGTVRRLQYAECPAFTDQRVSDMSSFYIKLQNDFFDDMIAYLKKDLGVKVPIVGTNWNVGPADLAVQNRLDYIDNHAYWDHPSFPHEPWDSRDWLINNTPMVKTTDGGTMAQLMAGVAAKNKPYTISEYNHAFPNRYQTEAMLFIAAYASFHEVDGLMLFDYNGSAEDWETDKVNGYFNINRNTAMMALAPSCAFAYRQGMIAKAARLLTLAYAPSDYLLLPKYDNGSWFGPSSFPRLLALQHAVRTETYASTTPMDFSKLPPVPTNPYVSDTQEIVWDTNGLLAVQAPQFIGVTGFLQNFAEQTVGSLKLQKASDFGTMTWIALTTDSLPKSKLSLLTLSSKLQNAGMVWDGIHTVHDRWGQTPTQMYPLIVTLQLHIQADSLRLYPLDVWGREISGFVTYLPSSSNTFEITLDQNRVRTVWFGVEKFGEGVATDVAHHQEDLPHKFILEQNHPNPYGRLPYSAHTQIHFALAQPGRVSLRIYDVNGREIVTLVDANMQAGRYESVLDSEKLDVSGVYFYRLQVDPQAGSGKSFVAVKKLLLIK